MIGAACGLLGLMLTSILTQSWLAAPDWLPYAGFGVAAVLGTIGMGVVMIRKGRWSIENGVVYRSGNALFRLDEIEAAREGLPENWVSLLASVPGRRTSVARAVEVQQDEILVVKLSRGRWFLWAGLHMKDGLKFRAMLAANAGSHSIEPIDIPRSIRRRLSIAHANKLLEE